MSTTSDLLSSNMKILSALNPFVNKNLLCSVYFVHNPKHGPNFLSKPCHLVEIAINVLGACDLLITG